MSNCRFIYHNGVVVEAPPVTTFLQSLTGAYTTTRTINNGSTFLFWERHMKRLSSSIRRLRKPLEKFRPPSTTELLLSNDGDHLLEGCITNFFVVCHRVKSSENLYRGNLSEFEVQTAPITDGVLPGVIRDLVIEVCLSKGIPYRERAPSWSERELWEEAFITSSLRILQHVGTIKVPVGSLEALACNKPEEIQWKEKRFKEGPGMITELIQKAIMERGIEEGFPLKAFEGSS